MQYKRAKRKLEAAGITHIVIIKGLWGAYPEDTRAVKQSSQTFNTWQEATEAVLQGYRPAVIEWREGVEVTE